MQAIYFACAILALTPSYAHAKNIFFYRCGNAEISLFLLKRNGQAAAEGIDLAVKSKKTRRIVWESIDGPVWYFVNHNKRACQPADRGPNSGDVPLDRSCVQDRHGLDSVRAVRHLLPNRAR
jgi:hypothetical protein